MDHKTAVREAFEAGYNAGWKEATTNVTWAVSARVEHLAELTTPDGGLVHRAYVAELERKAAEVLDS